MAIKRRLLLTVVSTLALAALCASCGSTGPDITPPLKPEYFRWAGGGDGEISLEWVANKERDLAGYYLYRTTDEIAGYTLLATLDPDTTSYSDKNLEYSTQYYYKLAAFDDAGNISPEAGPVSGIPNNLTAPATTQNVHAVAQNIVDPVTITVSWSPNAEGDLLEYHLFKGTQEPVLATGTPEAVISAGTSVYVDDDVSVGTRYYYKVIAVDRGGLKSSSSSATTVSDVPLAAPVLISPVSGATVSSLTPTLTWQGLALAEGYRIVVATDVTFSVSVWNTHVTSTPTSVQYAGTALSSGSQYFWKVYTTTVDETKANSQSATWSFIAP